jgi:hypothetical protein
MLPCRGGDWQRDADEQDGDEKNGPHGSPNLAPVSSVWRQAGGMISPPQT